jgi:hypothetical protein
MNQLGPLGLLKHRLEAYATLAPSARLPLIRGLPAGAFQTSASRLASPYNVNSGSGLELTLFNKSGDAGW